MPMSQARKKNVARPDSNPGSLNLNLNSLLVNRQIDNPSPGTVTGGT